MKQISVIIPVFNTGQYLHKCLKSIIGQKNIDLEIIIINDGSTDESTEILRNYQEEFPDLITLFEQENKGMSVARNKGIEIANGKYLGFVDSDDWISEEMYSIMVDKAESEGLDVVICDTADHYHDHSIFHNASVFDSKFTVTPSACNKIFLKSFINDLRFPENTWYEDFCFTTIALINTEKIGTIHETFYNCHVRPQSIMTNNNSQRNLDILKVLDIIKNHMITSGKWSDLESTFKYLVFDHVLITTINRVAIQKNRINKQVIKDLLRYCREQKLDFRMISNQFLIPRNRMIIARLNYYGFTNISKYILSINSKYKGR